MGNDDSGCTDYALDSEHDEFLGLTAKIIGEGLPRDLAPAERAAALREFSSIGSYNVPLAGMTRTRLLVLDDVFLSGSYITCSGKPDAAPAAAELAWLQTQLGAARQRHERVWVLAHIPPGVNFYASARTLLNACGPAKPKMFLGSERLAEVLAANADVVRLGLFGHTHSDEIHLLTREPARAIAGPETKDTSGLDLTGVPIKTVASITPVNGNRPTFTLARIDPGSATLIDYTVMMASNLTGVATTWEPEYTYSAAYGESAFDGASLAQLIGGFGADPGAKMAPSQAYLRNYFPGDLSSVIKFAWPQYACSMDHDSAESFAACACKASK
jgi:sphingomyelin phosphodiesterase acid-like 3